MAAYTYTYPTATSNFSSTSTERYKLDVNVVATAVVGGMELNISSTATLFNATGITPAFSSSGTRGYNVPNGRTSSTSGTLTESTSGVNWTYDFGANTTQNVWSGFNRYIASGAASTASVTITANGSGSSFLQSASTTLSGISLSIPYALNYNANGGSGSVSSTTTSSTSDSVSLTAASGSGLSRSGYTFTGWNTAANGSGTAVSAGGSFTLTGYSNYEQTLYAQWVVSDVTVTFDFQGGSGSPSSKTFTSGSSIGTLPSPTQGTYNFVGWYTTVGPTGGSQVSTSTTFSASTTIYARWESTVSFNTNGGTSVGAQYVPKGSSINVSSYSSARFGFTFLGWYSTTTGGTQYTTFTPTGSITLYANWQGTVTYSEQGGTTVSDATFVLGNSVSLPSTTRTGYSLSGWYTASSGGSSVGTAGQSYTPSSSLTLYAQWAALPVSWSDASLTLTARKGTAYSSTVAASYVNSWSDGILPSKGLSFTQGTNTTGSSTSTLSGTPNDYGDLTFTLIPYNADGIAGDAYTYTIAIADVALAWSDQVLTSSLATESVSFTDSVSVTAGPTTTYSIASGGLPSGVSLNSSTGAISGTPSAGSAGSYNFVVRATNGTGETIDTNTLTITVEAAGGYVKVWNGTAWADGTVYVRQSGAWTEATAKLRNASSGWTDSFSS